MNAWRLRDVVGGLPFSYLMAFGSFWLLGIGVMVTQTTPDAALFWYRVQFVSITAMPIALTIFVIEFHGYERLLTRKRFVLLSLLPLVSLFFVWTDDRFGLFFQDITIAQKNGLMLITSFTPGIWFHIHSAYSYLLSLLAIGWLIWRAVRQFSLYRRQSFCGYYWHTRRSRPQSFV